jgi:hypothetical protein
MFLAQAFDDYELAYKNLAASCTLRIEREGKVFVGWDDRQIQAGRYYYAFSHTPYWKLRLPESTATFTCLRDPIKRVVSHYRMLKDYQQSGNYKPLMLHEGNWLGQSFDDFLDRIPRCHLQNQLYMFSKNFDVGQAADRVLGLTHWMRLEDFQTGVGQLNEKTAVNLKAIHNRSSSHKFELSKSQTDRLRQMLSQEYEFLDQIKAAAPVLAQQ